MLGSGESLLFGRYPHGASEQPGRTSLTIPRCAPHVSRVLAELLVGDETIRLRWLGGGEATLSSLLDAPGGARRVTMTAGMTVTVDEGESSLVLLRGRQFDDGSYSDLSLVIEVERPAESHRAPLPHGAPRTARAPGLEPRSREWFVALALAEPWLSGADDYPRPPSNREIYDRVRGWHGYAWNLQRPQRVEDAIRVLAHLAFGPHDDPFAVTEGRRQNVRFAVGRRVAEVRLVTSEDLAAVERAARRRH